ncbi:MAG TPA: LacI family DNA-binding transcriptional regulator [Trueperaceae bacterium]|nr:LacI family DNA-binding transcriptional regulator [Trueperaceae bacterium]
MSTIRDIARRAGVAVSTASLALNDDARVRPETRQRVLEAAEALNYHPMRAARSLSQGLTWSLHLLDPERSGALSSGFFTRFVRGIHDTAGEQRYSVALSILDDETEAQSLAERLVHERWTDGIILMNPSASPAILEQLSEDRFPFVVLGRAPLPSVLSVDNDNERVAYDAATHLLRAAPGPVLLLNGPRYQTFTQDRAEGYRRALRTAGTEPDPDLVRFIPGNADAARQEVHRVLDEGLPFRSVLTVSDGMAIGAMRALRERGRHIPDDVAVMGMNNDDVAEYTDPQLSSVELNAYELGSRATSLLLAAVRGEARERERCIVAHSLALRESA